MNNIKQFKELKEGNCTVIVKDDNNIKEFEGFYSEEFKAVYFTILSHYEIIGYLQ